MPRVFLCYRRDDAAGHAGRLYDRLADRFGDQQIFRDLDSIPLGQDFGKAIDQMVASCDVFLAVIGSRWLSAADDQGRRRLNDPNDWVRLEIVAALKREIPVIPVLVDRAAMPGTADLPKAIAPLTRRNALTLTEEGWRTDIERLFRFLERAAPATTPEQVRAQEATQPRETSDEPSKLREGTRTAHRRTGRPRSVVEAGEIYTGKVTRIMPFGAFVEIRPGEEGLVHISELATYRVRTVEDVVNIGDEVQVLVVEIDRQGRINLSRRALLEPPDQ